VKKFLRQYLEDLDGKYKNVSFAVEQNKKQ